ncbi:MAG: ribonuclease P protein component [Bacilli bacterium]
MMKKKFRLKKNEEIQHVIQQGTSFANREFVLYHINHDAQPFFRISFSVSKKLGNAVERNALKRQMRSIIHSIHPTLKTGKDYVLIARMGVKRLDYVGMERSIAHVFRKQKLLNDNNRN